MKASARKKYVLMICKLIGTTYSYCQASEILLFLMAERIW